MLNVHFVEWRKSHWIEINIDKQKIGTAWNGWWKNQKKIQNENCFIFIFWSIWLLNIVIGLGQFDVSFPPFPFVSLVQPISSRVQFALFPFFHLLTVSCCANFFLLLLPSLLLLLFFGCMFWLHVGTPMKCCRDDEFEFMARQAFTLNEVPLNAEKRSYCMRRRKENNGTEIEGKNWNQQQCKCYQRHQRSVIHHFYWIDWW